jgi:hypothetical protein
MLSIRRSPGVRDVFSGGILPIPRSPASRFCRPNMPGYGGVAKRSATSRAERDQLVEI